MAARASRYLGGGGAGDSTERSRRRRAYRRARRRGVPIRTSKYAKKARHALRRLNEGKPFYARSPYTVYGRKVAREGWRYKPTLSLTDQGGHWVPPGRHFLPSGTEPHGATRSAVKPKGQKMPLQTARRQVIRRAFQRARKRPIKGRALNAEGIGEQRTVRRPRPTGSTMDLRTNRQTGRTGPSLVTYPGSKGFVPNPALYAPRGGRMNVKRVEQERRPRRRIGRRRVAQAERRYL
jgi:hypothetical protein